MLKGYQANAIEDANVSDAFLDLADEVPVAGVSSWVPSANAGARREERMSLLDGAKQRGTRI